jgi:hypothetical protein
MNTKLSKTQKIGIFALIGSIITFGLLQPRFSKIDSIDAQKMIKAKNCIYEQSKIENVLFEASKSSFSVNKIIFKKWLNIMQTSKATHILFRFCLEKEGQKDKQKATYKNLDFTIEGIDDNNETVDINNILLSSSTKTKTNAEAEYFNYQMAHRRLKNKQIKGFKNNHIDGVKFDIAKSIKWVCENMDKGDLFYFYPAIELSILGNSKFHTIIISTSPNAEKEQKMEYSYGNKGSGCCQ